VEVRGEWTPVTVAPDLHAAQMQVAAFIHAERRLIRASVPRVSDLARANTVRFRVFVYGAPERKFRVKHAIGPIIQRRKTVSVLIVIVGCVCVYAI
jgi:hypothetical protein